MTKRNFPGYARISFPAALFAGQHIAPSETQPIIDMDGGAQAQKIQNVYIYCEIITRMT